MNPFYSPNTFPFKRLALTISDPFTADEEELVISDPEDVAEAFNYTATNGLPRLYVPHDLGEKTRLAHGLCFRLGLLEQFQAAAHNRYRNENAAKWKVTIGSGSQDLLNKAFSSLINPGDPVLVEVPVYSGVLPLLEVYGANVIGKYTDFAEQHF